MGTTNIKMNVVMLLFFIAETLMVDWQSHYLLRSRM
uniref:Uncharacterized protein n=1 Tax=Vibrio parahaemolyticus TaxID=670 RepID=A0A0C5HCK1_VIBPH|nr:hypothetical protein pVPH1_0009 [Vibrio parahaemolyticus]